MELRVLRYFLAVARAESISGAAEALHLSQPTLSRQLKDLEDELGKQLFLRGNRRIVLTEDGVLLRKRANEILGLVDKTVNELSSTDDPVAGDVYLCAGETEAVHLITQAAKRLQARYPLVHYHISSGDSVDVTEQLDKGLVDFGLMFEPIDRSKYSTLPLPIQDVWGIHIRKDDPFAAQSSVTLRDVLDKPLILSRHLMDSGLMDTWFGGNVPPLNIVATYSLAFNGSLMVDDGMGCMICLDGILNTSGNSPLCFRPFSPPIYASMSLAWKKHQVFSKPAATFLEELRLVCKERQNSSKP